MSTSKSSVWFITGASKGFGLQIARDALQRGDSVVATARDPETITPALGAHENNAGYACWGRRGRQRAGGRTPVPDQRVRPVGRDARRAAAHARRPQRPDHLSAR